MDIAVIYDPNTEIAAVVDTDSMRALGPIGIGPDAQAELQHFVTDMPDAVMEMSSYDLSRVWAQFWQTHYAAAHAAASEGDTGTVDAQSDTRSDADTVAAREAVEHAASPPEPSPADTDMETDKSEAPKIVTCFACGGSGKVPGPTDGSTATCNLCNGVGKIRE